jgi:hypothetical protein
LHERVQTLVSRAAAVVADETAVTEDALAVLRNVATALLLEVERAGAARSAFASGAAETPVYSGWPGRSH